MGDLLMSSPAIRALKQTLNCRITLLTSRMGNLITPFLDTVDHTIVADLPWVKTADAQNGHQLSALIEEIKNYDFDGAVIFTVYSQNPLPAAMLAYMAGIPLRLSYCRENPYNLLTDWAVEKEPYTFIQHQVQRDLNLVKLVGAETADEHISIRYSPSAKAIALKKLAGCGVDATKDWLILHPGVSEAKRQYPEKEWIKAGRQLIDNLSFQVIITGSVSEEVLCEHISEGIGEGAFSLAGLLSIEEFIALISEAPLVISVNTGTAHIAAATQTPVIVLYALTNPQHTPWQVPSAVLYFSVAEGMRSKNEVVNYVTEKLMHTHTPVPSPHAIVYEARKLLCEVNV